MAFDWGFEDAGPLAGDADGWEISVTFTTYGWASFGARDWGVENYEQDWNNDDPTWAFEVSDLSAATFNSGADEFETFLYWPSLMLAYEDWDAVTDDAATFDVPPA